MDVYENINQIPMEASIICLQKCQLDAYRGVNCMPIKVMRRMPLEVAIRCLQRQIQEYSPNQHQHKNQKLDMLHTYYGNKASNCETQGETNCGKERE